jgi:hypothetical protein
MSWTAAVIFGVAGLALAGAAQAQSAGVSAGPNGELKGHATAPGGPSVSVQVGDGRVVTRPGPEWDEKVPRSDAEKDAKQPSQAGRGRSVTVRSPGGTSTSSAWTSGPGAGAVAGSGPPGSTITTDETPRRDDERRPSDQSGVNP